MEGTSRSSIQWFVPRRETDNSDTQHPEDWLSTDVWGEQAKLSLFSSVVGLPITTLFFTYIGPGFVRDTFAFSLRAVTYRENPVKPQVPVENPIWKELVWN